MNNNQTGPVLGPLFSAKAQKRHGQRADRHGGNDSAEPIVTLYGGIDASDDAGQPDAQSDDQGRDTLVENKRVDPVLLRTTGLRFGLGLVKNPIDAIGPDLMQTFDRGNREGGRIRLVVLHQQFGTVPTPYVRVCLTAHVSTVFADHGQTPRNRRAGFARPWQTRGDPDGKAGEIDRIRRKDGVENLSCVPCGPIYHTLPHFYAEDA